jgi:hypothetical protein
LGTSNNLARISPKWRDEAPLSFTPLKNMTHNPLTTFDNFEPIWKKIPHSELEIPLMGGGMQQTPLHDVLRQFWDKSWGYWLDVQWELDSAIYLQMELPDIPLVSQDPPTNPLDTFTPLYFRSTQGKLSYYLSLEIISPVRDDLWFTIFEHWDNGVLNTRLDHLHTEHHTRWLDAPRP